MKVLRFLGIVVGSLFFLIPAIVLLPVVLLVWCTEEASYFWNRCFAGTTEEE